MPLLIPSDVCTSIHFLIGQIKTVTPFPKARNPSYKLQVDFGPELQTLQTSAQLPPTYPDAPALVGRWVLGIVNFPRKNIAGFMSEFLLVGFPNAMKQVHLVSLVRDMPSLSSHLSPGMTLCGWQGQKYTAGSLSWSQFEHSEIRCGRIVAVLADRQALQLRIDEGTGEEAVVEAGLPLPLSFELLESQLLGTLAIYAPAQTSPASYMILAFSSSDGTACFPLGIDRDSQVVLHSHLY